MADGVAKAEALLDEGRAHLAAGRRPEAEACFRRAARICATPHSLNNWAMCRYLAGDHGDALNILAPVLGAQAPAPYTRALASLAHLARSERAEAAALLRAAIRDFDAGLAAAELRGGVPDAAWVEYTMLIKQAAGELGEHKLVLELHGRWPGRDLPQGAFHAGVAAFNLRKYAQAAKYWRRINHRDWTHLMAAHAQVADLVEQGLVPPFALEYDFDYGWDGKTHDPELLAKLLARGSVRVRCLALMFTGEADMAGGLIAYTGGWGIELGTRLLSGSSVSMPLKLEAARVLTEAGIFRPDQPIPIVHQGRSTEIVLKQMEVREDDPEAERVLAEAIRLRDAGRKDEAYRLLSDLQMGGVAHPQAMMVLANLMRERGELESAQSLLESLEKMAPDHPAVLFNLTGFWLQKGNLQRAREYVRRIDPADTSPEFRQRLALLKEQLEMPDFITEVPDIGAYADAMRAEAEEKPISLTLTLAAALKQVPVQWLNAAAALYQVAPARLRQERGRALAATLKDPARLRAALAAEAAEVRAALRHVLEQGGWCKLQVLTRRYGTQDGDGFWWDEQPPASPVGRLRVLGLVYVGRARVDGRAYKVAVVPTELRAPLATVL